MIIDDAFSGLDPTIEERIFSRLMGRQGLLRKHGITVILVTHGVHRLSYADHIIVLNTQGMIAEQGAFEQLMQSRGYVHSLAANYKSEEEIVVDELTLDHGPHSRNASVDGTKDQALAELSRQIGDVAIYKYYLASMGWLSTVLFLILISSVAFFHRFPGKLDLESSGT